MEAYVRFQSPDLSERGARRNRWLEATLEHCAVLDRYRVARQRVESDDPGRVVYEDEHQVVTIPRRGDGDR